MTATNGATRAAMVAQLVDHLRRLGWPLLLQHSVYHGCRETGGILPWTPHYLWLYADAEPMPARPATPPEAVIVYIGHVGKEDIPLRSRDGSGLTPFTTGRRA
ncbi:hypothetical protein [Micromonospora sp. L32]|uniref:hypothetical protein n=1 Tax=Micromonospora TaxID=1873 RepID=UPI003F89ECBC